MLTLFSDFAGDRDGDMSVVSDSMNRVPQRNGEMRDAQTQTDDDLLLTYVAQKEPVS